jgi:hypothetical protein
VERQNRRDADKILRETVARRFEEHWKRASELQVELVNSGMIQYVDDMEKAASPCARSSTRSAPPRADIPACSMRSRSTRRNSKRSINSTPPSSTWQTRSAMRLTMWKPASATKKPCPPPSAT